MKIYLVGPNPWNAIDYPFFEKEGAIAFAKYQGWNLFEVEVAIPIQEAKKIRFDRESVDTDLECTCDSSYVDGEGKIHFEDCLVTVGLDR